MIVEVIGCDENGHAWLRVHHSEEQFERELNEKMQDMGEVPKLSDPLSFAQTVNLTDCSGHWLFRGEFCEVEPVKVVHELRLKPVQK